MGANQKATNRPLQGLMNWVHRFPGLPAVALGYGPVAHFVGCSSKPARTSGVCIPFAEGRTFAGAMPL